MAFYIDKASSFFESCQGGRCGSILYSLKAVSEAHKGRMDLAIAALSAGEIFLRSVARKEWLAAQCMAKAVVTSKMTEAERAVYPDRELISLSPQEWAQMAASLFEKCGYLRRSEWLVGNFAYAGD